MDAVKETIAIPQRISLRVRREYFSTVNFNLSHISCPSRASFQGVASSVACVASDLNRYGNQRSASYWWQMGDRGLVTKLRRGWRGRGRVSSSPAPSATSTKWRPCPSVRPFRGTFTNRVVGSVFVRSMSSRSLACSEVIYRGFTASGSVSLQKHKGVGRSNPKQNSPNDRPILRPICVERDLKQEPLHIFRIASFIAKIAVWLLELPYKLAIFFTVEFIPATLPLPPPPSPHQEATPCDKLGSHAKRTRSKWRSATLLHYFGTTALIHHGDHNSQMCIRAESLSHFLASLPNTEEMTHPQKTRPPVVSIGKGFPERGLIHHAFESYTWLCGKMLSQTNLNVGWNEVHTEMGDSHWGNDDVRVTSKLDA